MPPSPIGKLEAFSNAQLTRVVLCLAGLAGSCLLVLEKPFKEEEFSKPRWLLSVLLQNVSGKKQWPNPAILLLPEASMFSHMLPLLGFLHYQFHTGKAHFIAALSICYGRRELDALLPCIVKPVESRPDSTGTKGEMKHKSFPKCAGICLLTPAMTAWLNLFEWF